MFYRVIDLAYCPRARGIDDEPLQRLLHGHRVIDAHERFYVQDGLPHLLVTVRYELTPLPSVRAGARAANAPDDLRTPKEPSRGTNTERLNLDPADRPLFDALRAWRSARARAEHVPAYVVMTNRQLADVVRMRPRSAADLAQIDGFGESRVAKLATELLQVLWSGSLPADIGSGTTATRSPARGDANAPDENETPAPDAPWEGVES